MQPPSPADRPLETVRSRTVTVEDVLSLKTRLAFAPETASNVAPGPLISMPTFTGISAAPTSVIVPDSPHLLQGKAEGKVTVMEVTGSKKKKASVAFERTVSVMFPEIYPIPRESRSEEMFTENFIDRISAQLAMMLYCGEVEVCIK